MIKLGRGPGAVVKAARMESQRSFVSSGIQVSRKQNVSSPLTQDSVDDIVLISDTVQGLQRKINLLLQISELLGLTVGPTYWEIQGGL